MKFMNAFSFRLWILVFLLLGIIIAYLLTSYANRITYMAEAFTESSEPLANPYQGFYHIIGYTLSDEYTSANASYQTDSYTASLALLEINLKNYRKTEISETGLAQFNDILEAWSQAPSNPKLILRFLYDWDGIAAVTEPDSLDRILTHMDQISPLVNQHQDLIYIIQGIFIGNWGEMHHSRFMDGASVGTLIRHLKYPRKMRYEIL